MQDYIGLLIPESTQDLYNFAVENIEPIIENIIHYVMDHRTYYLRLLNLLEI